MDEQRKPDHNAAIHDFKNMLRNCSVQGVCGRTYVRTEKLKKWLGSKTGSGSNASQASRLLRAAYRDRSQPGLPISSQQLSTGEDCCLLVFSVLLDLGLGQLVDRFRRHDIVDHHLPIDLLSLKNKLRAMDLPDAERLAERFDDMQWRFCAAKFDLGKGRDHPKNKIIPICRKEPINDKGGTAVLWQIAVQEEFVSLRLREVVSNSKYCDPRDNVGDCYSFALKTFEEGNRNLYQNEIEAFIGLQEHDGMIRYLADYAHKEMQGASRRPDIVVGERTETMRTTYNILLEYGDCDLDELFAADRLPPVFPNEIEGFWKGLFEVADVVEGIHNLKISTDGVTQEYHGWHADIKPDNILSVQGKFKLADPGFAKFVKKTDKAPEEIVFGGTATYGAPERYPRRSGTLSAVRQSIDIWSLGCVFSIAATWVVQGYSGIRQFRKLRENAIDKINKEQPSQRPSLGAPTSSPTVGDFFHDGREVLPEVISWHRLLRSAVRGTDTITSRVLDVVDEKMLLGDSSKRSMAKDICKDLTLILSQNQAKSRQPMPESIMKALLEVDEESASKATGLMPSNATPGLGQSLTVPQDHEARKARKSKLLDLPLIKTTHRSQYLKSALSSQSIKLEVEQTIHESVSEEDIPLQHPECPNDGPVPILPDQSGDQIHGQSEHSEGLQRDGIVHIPSAASISPTPLRPRHHSRSGTAAPQNVFQAREIVEAREKGNFWKRTRKDELLTRHFRNRDIKFLVDNGGTMKPHWYEATYLLETLVMKAAGQDKNGMDLSFTAGSVKVDNKRDKSDFTKAMRDLRAQPAADMKTDMRKSLGDILAAYDDELKSKSRYSFKNEVKDLTLIVLTDGIWKGVYNKDDVSQIIISFIKKLKGVVNDLRHRPVSIEFIQFGQDPDATYMLERLDKDLKWEGIPDIIDTEPSSGDVNKMLLGSFVEEYDEDDEHAAPESSQRLASPTRTSGFHSFSLANAPNMKHSTPSPHTTPTRPQTRQNTLSRSPTSNE